MSPCPECDLWLAGLIWDFLVGFAKGALFLAVVAAIAIPILWIFDRPNK